MSIQSLGNVNPSVTAVSGTTPTTMTSPPPAPALNGTLAGISQQLGMSAGAVQSALKKGSSINDLAQQRGAPRNTLLQSVEGQVQQSRQASGQPPLDQAVLDRMLSRAFEHHRRVQATGAAGAGGATAQSSINSPAPMPVPAEPSSTSAATGSGGFSALA